MCILDQSKLIVSVIYITLCCLSVGKDSRSVYVLKLSMQIMVAYVLSYSMNCVLTDSTRLSCVHCMGGSGKP